MAKKKEKSTISIQLCATWKTMLFLRMFQNLKGWIDQVMLKTIDG
jgi:hypothetical protein